MEAAHVPWLLLAMTMGFLLGGSVGHKDHIVGGSFGWKVPNNTTFYQEWAATRDIAIGDKIVFLFRTGVHNIIEVSREDYEACTMNNVTNMYYKGPTILNLTAPGPHYYYCGVGTHCEAGQKLSINVSSTPHPETVVADVAGAGAPAGSPATESSAGPSHYVAPVAVLFVYVLHHALFM